MAITNSRLPFRASKNNLEIETKKTPFMARFPASVWNMQTDFEAMEACISSCDAWDATLTGYQLGEVHDGSLGETVTRKSESM
jgi:hypothetical protein